MTNAIIHIRTEEERLAVTERAAAMLAQARTPIEAKRVADLAKAAETYARLQKVGEEAVSHARAICVEALALMGEMLKTVEKNKGGGDGSNQHKRATCSRREQVARKPKSLSEQGIPRQQSAIAQALATVKETKPELYERIKAGKRGVSAAHVEVKREEKREKLKTVAKAAPPEPATTAGWQLIRGEVGGDSDPLLSPEFRPGPVRLVFADPPYNIGFDYGEGHDDLLPAGEYLGWCERWMRRCAEHLAPDGSMWVLINDEWAAQFATTLRGIGLAMRNWIIWYESFGVNCSDKFNRTKRHLLYFVRDPRHFVFNHDAVSRPSDRQTKYQDARANPGGKNLDDVWFDVPRLVGTAAERLPDFPTQLPLALLRRVVECATEPGDLVLDPFSGSGTTGAACIELARRFVGLDRSADYVRRSTERLKGVCRVNVAG